MKHYFCLLDARAAKKRNTITEKLRDEGLRVPVECNASFEVLTTPERAEQLFSGKEFSAYTSSQFTAASLEKLKAGRRALAEQWNLSVRARHTRKRKELTDIEPDEPAPHTILDVDKLQKGIDALAKRKGKKMGVPRPIINLKKRRIRDLKADEYANVLKAFENTTRDETATLYLMEALPLMEPQYIVYLLDLSWLRELLDFIQGLLAEAACWEMRGKQAVGLIVIESSRFDGPKFGTTEREEVINEFRESLVHLENEFPGNDLAWVIDEQRIMIDVENQNDGDGARISEDEYFLFPGLEAVNFNGNTYAGSFEGLDNYREDMRLASLAEHAFVIFVTPFGASWHGYSVSSKFFILQAKHPNSSGTPWGGRGQDGISITTLHEVVHRYNGVHEYGAADQGSQPCSACNGKIGCDKVPNGNCVDCNDTPHECTMRGGSLKLCPWTRAQVGWADLFVELYTADETWAGTDDAVYLDIGDQSFRLDTPNFNDREQDQKDGYAIWAGGNLDRSAIRRILIRKESVDVWKLRRCRVWHGGEIICDESPKVWLDDNNSVFLGCSFDDEYVNSLRVVVSTANVLWAGTDDDVTFSMGGRSWNLDNHGLNDFESGDTNTFNLDPGTGLKRSDITNVRIRKSPDGFAGGWKLGSLRVEVNGAIIYNKQSINQWLENNSRTFTDNV